MTRAYVKWYDVMTTRNKKVLNVIFNSNIPGCYIVYKMYEWYEEPLNLFAKVKANKRSNNFFLIEYVDLKWRKWVPHNMIQSQVKTHVET